MYKTAVLIRRNPGLTSEQFRTHYEAVHAPLASGFMPKMLRYTRHFLTPYGNTTYAAGGVADYDVITEMWFETESDFLETMAQLSRPDIAAQLGADELRVFDRESIRIYVLEDSGDPIT